MAPPPGTPPEATAHLRGRRVDDARYQPPLAWSDAPAGRPRPDHPRPAQPQPDRRSAGYAPTQKPEPLPGDDRPRRSTADRADESRRSASRGSSSRGSAGAPPRKPRSRGAAPTPAAKPKRRRRLRVGRLILAVLLLFVVASVGLLFYYDSKLNRTDALVAYAGRPADTPGTNWLIVGTDSRADLSAQQRAQLSTGDSDGSRTDTIMMVHKPPSGRSMIISIPRDLYVPVPGQGSHKVNAAFNIGGPQLLVQTIEQLSGVRIDHYAEIGFGGFDSVVDAVGGVTICLDQPLNDPKAGLRLPKGCQELDGRQALGLVRTRAFPNADLERVVNQRKFLNALMAKATSPSVLANLFRLIPFANGAVDAVTVDDGDHIWNLFGLALALRGDPITTTTPSAGSEYTSDGDSLAVGDNTEQFFGYLRKGTAVPDELLSGPGGVIGG
ncbi:LCP family protein [Gordonia insulae]|uniref:Regulatory protein MsrR n=1 Tax=Gordonia insulae TaxID=2420509 RepID=A0A3G8JPJ8_9ACTN|nr:LCP family protein [Gordonia insulae]AZG46893.1 Regulatory protein MsrR [Gordonia insulae]